MGVFPPEASPSKPKIDTAQTTDAGTSANALVLTVVGLAKTRVIYQATGIVPTASGAAPYTLRDSSNEDLIILNYDVQLASFGGKAQSGEHNFPFSVVMPSELPPSMKVRNLAVFHGFSRMHSLTIILFFILLVYRAYVLHMLHVFFS